MNENTRPPAEETPGPEPSGATPSSPARPPAGKTAPQPSSPESKRRKGKIILVLVLVGLALGAIGVAGWMYYENLTARRAAIERLDEATALVEAADQVVLDVDEVVRAEIDTEVGKRAGEVAPQVPGAMDELAEALALIEEALEELPDDELAYAAALEASAKARLEMLEQAEVILEANQKAAVALEAATQAWDLVIEAEEISAEAVEEYNKLTREGVTKSSELTSEARERVVGARELFSKATTGFPEADMSGYVEYCDAKLDALDISKRADEAWLAEKPAEANTLSDEFNEARNELAERVEELPSSPAEPISDAYEKLAGEATGTYFDARSRATEADEYLREITGEPDSGGGGEEGGGED